MFEFVLRKDLLLGAVVRRGVEDEVRDRGCGFQDDRFPRASIILSVFASVLRKRYWQKKEDDKEGGGGGIEQRGWGGS